MKLSEQFLVSAIRAFGVLCVIMFFLLAGSEVESHLFPALTSFKVGTVERTKESDLIITGSTVVKSRHCTVIQPWRGKTTITNRQVLVDRDGANQPNWATTGLYQTGQITIRNVGPAESVEIWAEHRCHNLWNVTSKLGVVK